jgi:hypothetical protein
MAKDATSLALAARARRNYVEGLLNAVPSVVQAVEQAARHQLSQVAERGLTMRRRDLVDDLQKAAPFWLSGMVSTLQEALSTGSVPMSRFGDLSGPDGRANKMSLVDNDTIESEILSSRLALAMMDSKATIFCGLMSWPVLQPTHGGRRVLAMMVGNFYKSRSTTSYRTLPKRPITKPIDG